MRRQRIFSSVLAVQANSSLSAPPPAKTEQPAPPPRKVELPAPPAKAETPAPPAKAEQPALAPAQPTIPPGELCVARPADAIKGGVPAPEPAPAREGAAVVSLPATKHASLTVELRFRSGAIDDPPGKAGLTKLLAALVSEGGTESLDAKALREALFPFAVTFQERVDKEWTTFEVRMHKDHLDRVLPLFLDTLLHPRWDEKELTRLRAAAVDDVEKRLRQGDDENLGKEAMQELLFEGHPYGRLTIGHVRELRSITLADVKEHAARVLSADRLTVGVAGAYPDGLPAEAARTLAALPAKGAPAKELTAIPARGVRYLLVEKPGQATAISLGLPWALSRNHPDFAAMLVARSAFGEHRQHNGRLMQRLREQRGLNYGDYAYLEHFEEGRTASQAQTGRARRQQYFSIWLRPVQNENALFALRAALYELRRSLTDEPFGEAEVESTKSFLAGYVLLFDQTDARKLGFALDERALGMRDFLASLRRQVAQVTEQEVNAAWRRWMDPCALQVVLVGPGAEASKRIILSGEVTKVHYQRDAQGKSAERPAELLETDARVERFPLGARSEEQVRIVDVGSMFE